MQKNVPTFIEHKTVCLQQLFHKKFTI